MDNEIPLLALDIGGTYVRTAVVRGRHIIASTVAAWPSNLSPANELHFIADRAVKLLSDTESSKAVYAAGVSLAASIDSNGTVVQWPNRPAWVGLPFRSLLEARLGIPIMIDDDANAAAMAEWTCGAGRGYQHLLVVMVGTGVGAGLILNGHLFRGSHGWAGELGHLVVSPNGPACPCGHRGCLQMMASGRSLEQAAGLRRLFTAVSITTAADQGEVWACQALEDCGRWLGLATANVVNLLDLEAVIIGGGVSSLGIRWWSALKGTLETNLLNRNYRDVALHKAALPDTAGLLGAAVLTEQLVDREVY